MWKGPGRRSDSGPGGASFALADDLAPGPRAVFEEEAGGVVVGPGPQELGHRRRYRRRRVGLFGGGLIGGRGHRPPMLRGAEGAQVR